MSKQSAEGNEPQNVFGTKVDDQFVKKKFPEFETLEVNAADKSYFAYRLKEAVQNGTTYKAYMQTLRKIIEQQPDTDNKKYTICEIYNATGSPIHLLKKHHDFSGHILGDNYFPVTIENGQLAVVLHQGSSAAVIYTGQNYNGKPYAWLHAWENERDDDKRYVFTEIEKPEHYVSDDWNLVSSKLTQESPFHDGLKGSYSEASIRGDENKHDNVCIYSGTLTLEWGFPLFSIN
ncbi:uncharacterized protein LOC132799146 [Ziziphus jujuba]|uniref:Uncharacterized protein LOC132799146 n=1 Tax=Ziziphus jujuba TaxID=326968 RepID=A0A6P3ZBT7_ZIZJJ|nr:uncharacterized protein LOC132799146 [Ziziphus jujuba]